MPRNGSGVYGLPPGTPGVPDTPVESAPYNTFTADVEGDLNLPRPIVAGGTGASTAAQALINLGAVPLAGGVMTGGLTINAANPTLMLKPTSTAQPRFVAGTDHLGVMRWAVVLGDNTAEGGANAGSNFSINGYNDAGTFLHSPVIINRSDGIVAVTTHLNLTNAAPSLRFNSNNAVYRSGNYTVIADAFGVNPTGKIFIGSAADPSNYHDNTAHHLRSRDGTTTFLAASSTGVGVGTGSPAVKLHVLGNAELARLQTTAVRGGGNLYVSFHDTTGQRGYFGYPSGSSDVFTLYQGVDAPVTFYQNATLRFELNNTAFTVMQDITVSKASASLTLDSSSGNAVINLRTGGSRRFMMNMDAAADSLYIYDADFSHGVVLAQNSGSWSSVSDARLKTKIDEYTVLDKVHGWNLYSFTWNSTGQEDVGAVAQEVNEVFPFMVNPGSTNGLPPADIRDPGAWTMARDYAGLLALQGVKELLARVEALESV